MHNVNLSYLPKRMKFVLPVILVFSFVAIALVPSENLYAQILPLPPSTTIPNINIMSERVHLSNPITAAGNDESPVQSNNVNGDNNRLQNCVQSGNGEENSQSLNCQQNQNDNSFRCPDGYYRNSFGYCVPILLPTPFDD